MISTDFKTDFPTMEHIILVFHDKRGQRGPDRRYKLTVEIGPNDEIGNGKFVGDKICNWSEDLVQI